MKKYLKFSGIVALVFALVAFILLMASHSVVYAENTANWYSGISAVFGGGTAQISIGGWSNSGSVDAKLAWPALIGWILILVAMVIILAGIILPLLKVKALDKFLGLITLVAAGLLIVAAIFAFVSKGVLFAVNEYNNANDWTLGAGWVIGGILFILAGGVAACPVVLGLLGKK